MSSRSDSPPRLPWQNGPERPAKSAKMAVQKEIVPRKLTNGKRNSGVSKTKTKKRDSSSLAVIRSLVGRAVQVWLLEDQSRETPPLAMDRQREWVQKSSTRCFMDVSKRLRKFVDVEMAKKELDYLQAEGEVDYSWFLEPEIKLVALGKARTNYASWIPPLSDDEWLAEVRIMKELSRKFRVAHGLFKVHAGESLLALAATVARTAADAS